MYIIIIIIAFTVLFLVFAVIFLMGKGDMLIAGYNTANEEEKKKVKIKRLRIIMAAISVISASYVATMPVLGNNMNAQLGSGVVFILIVIIFVILANTWAKNKCFL